MEKLLLKRIITPGLLAALIVPASLLAEEPGSQPAAQSARAGLRIYVLQGEGAVNNTVTRLATPPVVEVRDANDFPVAGATVTFQLPASGPSAAFEGGKLEYSNFSDARGQASAGLMTTNGIEGQVLIKVTAQIADRSGMVTIRQTNSPSAFSAQGTGSQRPSFWRRNRLLLIGVSTAGAVGLGYFFATRDRSSGAVLSPGTVVIGGPR
jgi:hypothetical protein